MIRGIDNKGNVILGITRREIEGLLEGLRCCFAVRPELGGGPHPHIDLWFAETDADLIARMAEMFPERQPAEVLDLRTKKVDGQ